MARRITILFLLACQLGTLFPQQVCYHVSNQGVYNFLDEMANLKFIELNSVVKPYSRLFIAKKLLEIKEDVEEGKMFLNTRQTGELIFYLKDFNKELLPGKNFDKRKDLFYYKDSVFTLSINPIGGIQYWHNVNGTVFHRWNGAEAFAYIKGFGVYASLRDNHESSFLSSESFLNTRQGANYKFTDDGGGDYSEMRGGISYSWEWGSLAFVKDHFEWGNYYHYPTVFSSKPPSIVQLKFNLKPVDWLEFNYIHGWLISEVIDSVNSYTFVSSYGKERRSVMRKKYLSANMFTFNPFKNLYLSAGNSIVFSDVHHAAYFIPFMFYKSVDHTLNATDRAGRHVGQNSQMFFDISSRQIKHLHLFAGMFIDELSVSRFFKKELLNFINYKAGFQVTGLPSNTFLSFEWIRTNPLVYKHNIITTTFESNGYNMGHYLQDNAMEFYFAAGFRPIKKLLVKGEYITAKRGKDYTSLGTYRVGNPYMDSVEWISDIVSFMTRYQVVNDAYIFLKYQYSSNTGDNSLYTPEFFMGNLHTFSGGLNIGF